MRTADQDGLSSGELRDEVAVLRRSNGPWFEQRAERKRSNARACLLDAGRPAEGSDAVVAQLRLVRAGPECLVSGRLVTHPEPAPLTAQLDREATASKCPQVRALLAISVVWWMISQDIHAASSANLIFPTPESRDVDRRSRSSWSRNAQP